MRKRLFKLTTLFALLSMILGLSFASCSDDDDSGTVVYHDYGQYFSWDNPKDTIFAHVGDTIYISNNISYYKVVVTAAKAGEVSLSFNDGESMKLNSNEGMYLTVEGKAKTASKASSNPGSVLLYLKDASQYLMTPKKSPNSKIKNGCYETWFARPASE